jgi:hypothetical protein
MGSSIDEVAKGWVGITSGKFLLLKVVQFIFYVVNVGLWCHSY